jgi:hypothetical protein
MSSDKKKAAARANGAKGRGPTSERGKSHAKMNALTFGIYAKSGLLPGEDTNAYAAVRKQIFDEICPIGFVESVVVDRIVYAVWHILRLKQIQTVVLIRTEIVLSLTELAQQAGELFVPPEEVERALRHALSPERDRASRRGATGANAESPAETENVVPLRPAIPVAYTLHYTFGPGEIGQASAEIERQYDKAVKELLRLYRELEELRSRRRTYTIPAVKNE